MIARLLLGFHFLSRKDEQGKQIDVDIFDYTNGFNWLLQSFECIITPRTVKIAETIRRKGDRVLEKVAGL